MIASQYFSQTFSTTELAGPLMNIVGVHVPNMLYLTSTAYKKDGIARTGIEPVLLEWKSSFLTARRTRQSSSFREPNVGVFSLDGWELGSKPLVVK